MELEARKPFVFLQSCRTEGLRFAAVPVDVIAPGYPLDLLPEHLRLLHADDERDGDLISLAIVRLPEDGPPTANLLAPVVIHRGTRRGVQAVRSDARFSAYHPLGTTPCW